MRREPSIIPTFALNGIWLALAALVCGGLCSQVLFAKEVFIEWKPVTGAIRYELEVERDGKPFAKKAFEESKWTGDLPNGFYAYRLRSVDKLKRPGAWSDYKALVVMPHAPKMDFPGDGDEIKGYVSKGAVELRWKPVEGVSKYHVAVKSGSRAVYDGVVAGTRMKLTGLSPGSYSWQISSVVDTGRAPASYSGKTWESEIQTVDQFTIVHRDLEAPSPVSPRGRMVPSVDKKIVFKWKPVEGADGYQIQVRKSAQRTPANEKVFTVKDTTFAARLPADGDYVWEVRAIAGVEPGKSVDTAGPRSETEFSIDPSARFTDPDGYIALSTVFAPYSYKIMDLANGNQGTFNSQLVQVKLTGEYWFDALWGVSAGVDEAHMAVGSASANRSDLEAFAKFRIAFSDSRYGWVLIPKAGGEIRHYPVFIPTDGSGQTFTVLNPGVIGPAFGFDLRKQFSEKLSVGARFEYFKPLAMLSSGDGTLTGPANMRNLSLGVQGLYWLGGHWGAGAGLFLDQRSLSILPTQPFGHNGTRDAGAVYMDGVYFFGSLIYSFGK